MAEDADQEADLVSPGFEQSTAISNRSTLDFTLHYGKQRIVLPGDALWKRLCSSSVPPDDDDDDDDDDEKTWLSGEATDLCPMSLSSNLAGTHRSHCSLGF